MKNKILKNVESLLKGMNQQEQCDFIWEIICKTSLEGTMDRIDGGYEILLEMDEEEEEEEYLVDEDLPF